MASLTKAVNAKAAEMVSFLNKSWTQFHAVDTAKNTLLAAGYTQLFEYHTWNGKVKPGGKYFFTRNSSCITAFAVGEKAIIDEKEPTPGFAVIGAHTDSPCLKLKPISKLKRGGYLLCGVQTYGGGLWHTWFDRDLSVAGRVIVKKHQAGNQDYEMEERLVKIERPLLRIPTLAIHLNRKVNSDGFKFNNENELAPVLSSVIADQLNSGSTDTSADHVEQDSSKKQKTKAASENDSKDEDLCVNHHHSVLLQVLAQDLQCEPSDILDFELQLCDVQPSTIGGALNEFIFSGRLDNLACCFCSMDAFMEANAAEDALKNEKNIRMMVHFDHEECGSRSSSGAMSSLLTDSFRRIIGALIEEQGANYDTERITQRCIHRSLCVSADMAHALHPNYISKHESNHGPLMHKGLVIKHNVNQRYATNSVTAQFFREIGRIAKVPLQEFVVRQDMACGSTIGPITAANTSMRTLDVGAPQWSMHSVREMMGTEDVEHAVKHFTAFYTHFQETYDRFKFEF